MASGDGGCCCCCGVALGDGCGLGGAGACFVVLGVCIVAIDDASGAVTSAVVAAVIVFVKRRREACAERLFESFFELMCTFFSRVFMERNRIASLRRIGKAAARSFR